jgi:hypothetical protein
MCLPRKLILPNVIFVAGVLNQLGIANLLVVGMGITRGVLGLISVPQPGVFCQVVMRRCTEIGGSLLEFQTLRM